MITYKVPVRTLTGKTHYIPGIYLRIVEPSAIRVPTVGEGVSFTTPDGVEYLTKVVDVVHHIEPGHTTITIETDTIMIKEKELDSTMQALKSKYTIISGEDA